PGNEIVHYIGNGLKHSFTEKHLLAVDSDFLQFFDYPLLEGDRKSCLNGPNSIVLTESAARRYFGEESPLGKTLVFDKDNVPFTVTAVLKDLPEQSSLQFDILRPVQGISAVKRFSWSWIWLQMG